MILASDIGGTKTYLALMEISADKLIMVKYDKLSTKEIHSIEETF
jgi:glucokinase